MTFPIHNSTPIAVSLKRLFPHASFVGCADIRTMFATDRSSECKPLSLFAVIRGSKSDGRNYVTDAIQRGSVSLLVERPLADVELPQCVVPNVRRAYAELCAALASHPERRVALAGVTGTNGKTTTTWLIRSILRAAGKQAGILVTIEYSDGVRTERSTLTTPDPRAISEWLRSMVAHGTTHAAMEVSSHALDQSRIAALQLDAAVVTNITQDHFDYHGDFNSYRATKRRILERLKAGAPAIINVDDAGSRSLLEDSVGRVVTYGLVEQADVSGTILEETLAGSRFRLTIGAETAEVTTSLIGRHNVSNCLAAAAVAQHCGATLTQIVQGIGSLTCVPGRMEPVNCGQQYSVLVDYAHTEDALRRSLRFLRKMTPGRLICVFGCGGDRDKSKRPRMGQAATESDLVVVTSDNPRTEDPSQIIREILVGCEEAERQPHVELDRAAAIQWALDQADPGDCVLIAGKGHETEQVVGTQRIHLDDREVVRKHLGTDRLLQDSPHFRRFSVHGKTSNSLPR